MLKDSILNRCFIRASIFGLRAIAPLATAYCFIRLIGWRPHIPFVALVLLDLYAAGEAVFLTAVYLPRKWLLNRPAPYQNPLSTRAIRKEMYEKTWSSTHDARGYLSRWFYGSPIEVLRTEDIKDFITWRMWNTTERSVEYEDEIDEYLAYTGTVLKWKFPPGRSNTKSMMVTFEPLETKHRPLFWYMIVATVETQFWFLMNFYGFHHYRSSIAAIFRCFPIRILSMISTKRSASNSTSYWYRKHRSKDHLPILFIHGIGVGLHTYLRFFKHYLKDMPDVGIIAIEVLSISARIAPPFLHGTAMSKEISKILKSHGWDKCILATHSYGSVIAAYLLHDTQTSPMIDHMLFIDPVTFSFHTGDVAYNFLRRKPRTASEIQLKYFAATDLDVTYTLTRMFSWSENSLWRDEVENRTSVDQERALKTTVVLSGKDIITDTLHLGQYLTREETDDSKWYEEEEVIDNAWKNESWTGKRSLEVVWLPDLNHAECFDNDENCDKLVRILQIYSEDT